MNTREIVQALIASAVLFISNLMTLFAQDADLTFQAIKQSAWVFLIGGAVVAALKRFLVDAVVPPKPEEKP